MIRAFVVLLALLLTGAAPPDWTRTVTRTAQGAFVLGNPQAKVRVIEYLSYTCGHCATLVKEASAPLKARYVARGTVALELRNAVRDRVDFTAALLARCGAAGRFFGNSEALFAAQGAILAKATTAAPANASVDDAIKALARSTGMSALMARRGYTPAQLDACLTDKASQDAVLAMTREAWETRNIPGTPYVLVADVPTAHWGWATVEPAIRAALAK